MRNYRTLKRWITVILVVMVLIPITFFWISDQLFAQAFNMFAVITTAVIFLVIHREKEGLLKWFGSVFFAVVLPFFEETSLAVNLCKWANKLLKLFCDKCGYKFVEMHVSTVLNIAFWVIFLFVTFVNLLFSFKKRKMESTKDANSIQSNHTAMYELICDRLSQQIQNMNRDLCWDDNVFVPVNAEIELYVRGNRKKKTRNLLRYLKNTHGKRVHLLIGRPGSGKSVVLRKLCLDMLRNPKLIKRIPVYIDLKRWDDPWREDNLPHITDLINFLKTEICRDQLPIVVKYIEDNFDKMLEQGQLYFIFDGFNEIPCLMGRNSCQALIDKISKPIFDLLTQRNQGGGIIASRDSRAPKPRLNSTATVNMVDFDDYKIKTAIQRQLYDSNDFCKRLFKERNDLVSLCRKPFELGLLIHYAKTNGLSFPEDQRSLYKNFIQHRLDECCGELELHKMNVDVIIEAAKQLAQQIQESSKLEYPIDGLSLSQNGKIVDSDVFARIMVCSRLCRSGGNQRTISFVHQKFQEYFYLEYRAAKQIPFQKEEYEGILYNSNLRDILVLYCDYVDIHEASKIAEYCWDYVKKAFSYKNGLTQQVELSNVLYFMADAFYNKKEALKNFQVEFEKIIRDNLKAGTDFILQHALASCIALFRPNEMQSMILRVFALNNRWLSDYVFRNCGMITELDLEIERGIQKHILSSDLSTFQTRFKCNDFTLSLRRELVFVRILHFVRYVRAVLRWLLAIGASLIFLSSELREIILQKNIFYSFESVVTYAFGAEFSTGVLRLRAISMTLLLLLLGDYASINDGKSIFKKILGKSSPLFMMYFAALLFRYNEYIYRTFYVLFMMTVLLPVVVCFGSNFFRDNYRENHIHEFNLKSYFTKKNICNFVNAAFRRLISVRRFVFTKTTLKLVILYLAIPSMVLIVVPVMLCIIFYIIDIIRYPISCLFIASIAIGSISWIVYHDKRIVYSSRNINTVSREAIVQDLGKIITMKWKCIYLDNLLSERVTLVGAWPNGIKPEYNHLRFGRLSKLVSRIFGYQSRRDEFEVKLAKLECSQVKDHNSRF